MTFDSYPGFDLALTSLDPQVGKARPELVAVTTVGPRDQAIERATVFVPEGGLSHFISRFEDYATANTPTGKPKYRDFTERIQSLRLATMEALWTDDADKFPEPTITVWWEVWLRRTDGQEIERLTSYADSVGAQVGRRHLVFDNRIIALLRGSAAQLARSIDLLDDLAELRSAKVTAEFFVSLPVEEQAAWMEELLHRTRFPARQAPVVAVLDTGLNRGHPLLEPAVGAQDVHTCEPSWGSHDHDGHGTEMAGVALYGNLANALADPGDIEVMHGLESVKVVGPRNDTDPELYAAVTAEAVSRVEVQAPERRRTFCMAVSASDDQTPGTPTSWSSAIDALAAGRAFDLTTDELRYIDNEQLEQHRLFILAAGNVRRPYEADHLSRSDLEPVEDPAQAWNALTVGAYTNLVDAAASGGDFLGYQPLAPAGELSPFSRTSVSFDRQWPIKPEITCEGGNGAMSPGGDIDTPESLQLLTTYLNPDIRLFTTINATSAAAAEASRIAAIVAAEYPGLWPETVRALLVHSSEWTPAMKARLDGAGSKTTREGLVRRYGLGVPSLDRALRSAGDALTLVLQETIRPFDTGRLREMQIHELPWPIEVLNDLGGTQVRLRVTLSYFVEPNPTRRGWRRRYRYASHGLRFEMKQPQETDDEFRKRLNKLALEEDEGRPAAGDTTGWFLGSRARNRGSLHTDLWYGTAADLAARGRVAIYPVHGWWKELPKRDRSSFGARYGLVISIDTPVETVDLWTPVAQQVGIPIDIPI